MEPDLLKQLSTPPIVKPLMAMLSSLDIRCALQRHLMGQELTLPEAEVQSFHFGLVSIKDLGVTKVLLCSNAVEVVKAIKG